MEGGREKWRKDRGLEKRKGEIRGEKDNEREKEGKNTIQNE